MIYFAMGGVAWAIPETGGTWTAISKVPSLTAIALWGQGGGTRGGGGMFTSNRSYWLDTDSNTFPIRDTNQLRRDSKQPPDRVIEKIIHGGWILRRTSKYPRKDRFDLERSEDGTQLHFPDWEWANWDRNRLIWADNGCLRAAKLVAHKLGTVRTLHDFNKPEQNQ